MRLMKCTDDEIGFEPFNPEILRNRIEKSGLSKSRFATKCNISLYTINKLLQGKKVDIFAYLRAKILSKRLVENMLT